ncbi:hypothetical protein ACFQV2_15420 [Actinokineospora soli]|uniref:Polyketide synthase dehydratase n=1 Tax=Actinokineospora soli TaxID=1048753 RepID=A0ABW2TLS7_9PSEU
MSTKDMPWLVDHCLIRQRPGWRDETDLRPVVPATTILHHMVEAAVRPGTVAIGVDDLRLHRWLVAAPAVEVRVETRAVGPDRVAVRLGDHAEGTVLLAPAYPAAPEPWTPSADEQPPRSPPSASTSSGGCSTAPPSAASAAPSASARARPARRSPSRPRPARCWTTPARSSGCGWPSCTRTRPSRSPR